MESEEKSQRWTVLASSEVKSACKHALSLSQSAEPPGI